MSPNDLMLKALFGIVLPALTAGITLGLAWRIWNRNAPPFAGGTWAGALAVGLAMIVGYVGSEGLPEFPPRLAIQWLVFIASAAIIAGFIETVLPCKIRRSMLWLLIVGGSTWVLTETPRGNWKGAELALWLGGLTAGMWLIPVAIEPIAPRRPGASLPLALWVWCAGIAASLAMTGSILYGHLAGILAAAMGAALVASWIKPSISLARGAAATLMTLGLAFLICGYFYSDLPASSALILAAAPLTLWLGESKFVMQRKAWMAVVFRALFIALPVTLALLFAAWPMLFPKPSKSGSGSSAESDFYK